MNGLSKYTKGRNRYNLCIEKARNKASFLANNMFILKIPKHCITNNMYKTQDTCAKQIVSIWKAQERRRRDLTGCKSEKRRAVCFHPGKQERRRIP